MEKGGPHYNNFLTPIETKEINFKQFYWLYENRMTYSCQIQNPFRRSQSFSDGQNHLDQ